MPNNGVGAKLHRAETALSQWRVAIQALESRRPQTGEGTMEGFGFLSALTYLAAIAALFVHVWNLSR